ncbi:hypothetical protein A2U01_0020221, partial [Trifolium medium]|nr:hypothetical protein [Trifolium medium]
MLCPRCSAVCDKEATAGLTHYVPYVKDKGKWPRQGLNKRKEIVQAPTIHQRLGPKTFVHANRVPGTQKSAAEAKKYSYRNNYMGKNPMTRTQWRKFQRQKKQESQKTQTGGKIAAVEQTGGNVVAANPVEVNTPVGKEVEMVKRPIKERISLFPNTPPADNVEEEYEFMDDDLLDEDLDFDVLVNVVSILPREYDMWSMSEEEDLEESLPVSDVKLVCYYVMDNGCVEQQQAIFEKPDEGMKNHLKPLFVRAKVNDVSVNKVLIYGGAAVNLMPLSLLSKIGKYETDLHSHNIVLSNYEGKSGHSWGAIQVDVAIGSSV